MNAPLLLNPSQQAAVDHRSGPALIVAGAGSGKTRVITARITRLLREGNLPGSIFALTFTNKAATEMRERIATVASKREAEKVWISTFHALGVELLRRERNFVAGGERFVVYDAADVAGVVREILRGMNVAERRFDVGAIVARISHAKNVEGALDDGRGEYDEVTREVLPRYVEAMRSLNALDFDDLIGVPLRLLEEVPEVSDRWHTRIRHLLVDEFQDTNRTQLRFVRALCGTGVAPFCVGDDDQAIYGWRGADVRNVIDFGKHFPGAVVLPLEDNYRSTPEILAVANAVIEPAVRAYPKVLRASRESGRKVEIVVCNDGEAEAKFALETTREALKSGTKRSQIGVLYRSNTLARVAEDLFRTAGVAYRMIGGTSMYERKEVKDLVAYLRLALIAGDEISFRRVVNYPSRGIGPATLDRLARYARARNIDLVLASRQSEKISDLDVRSRAALAQFVALLDAIKERIERGAPLEQVARTTADTIRLRDDIVAAGPTGQIVDRRWKNVEDLFRSLARESASNGEEARNALARFSLRIASDDEDHADLVTLSTLHGAKGLEFDLVILLGLDEGILPHGRHEAGRATDIAATLDVSEERRLFYVGVTRARRTLHLVRARARAFRGPPKPTVPSRFLAEIPEHLVLQRDFVPNAPMPMADLARLAREAREALAAAKTST